MCSMLQNLDNKCGRIHSRSWLAGASQQATRLETIWYSLTYMGYGTTNFLQVHTFFKAKFFALKQWHAKHKER